MVRRRAASRLVGRGAALAALDEDLRSVGRGQLGVTLLSGGAGMGKTSLVAEFVARRGSSVVALLGRAYPLGATDALGVWVDALEGHLRTLDSAEVARLCGSSLGDLSDLLPSAGLVAGVAESRPSRVRMLGGLARLLTALSGDKPLLIVLDDVHLADASSWAALSYLAHQLHASPILMLLVARSVELAEDPAASAVVMALQQEGLLRRERLGPLDRAGLAELASDSLGRPATEGLAQFLVDRSRGVPLFALGLLRALVEEGADITAPVLRSLPEDLSGYARRQLALLSDADRETVELLAVLGKRVDLVVLETLSKQPAGELIDSIGRLVRQELVVEEERGAVLEYELAHPLIQEAVYGTIGGARRQAIHRGVAQALVAAGRPDQAAAHFVRSARVGDGEAIEVLRVALADVERRDDHRAALALLDALLVLLPAGDRRWLDIADVMAWQTGWVIDHRADIGFETALRAMRRIESALTGSSSVARQAAVKCHLGSFLVWGAGETSSGRGLVEEAVALFEQVGERRAALLARNELGYVLAISGDHDKLGSIAQSVLTAAVSEADRVVELQALCAWAHALVWGGRLAEARAVIDRALRIAKEDRNLYRVSYLLAQRGYERALSGDLPAARHLLELGRDGYVAFLDTHLPDYASFTAWLGGRLSEGVEQGRAVRAWEGGHISRRRVFGACFAALCALELGADEEPGGLAAAMRAVFNGRDWWFHSALPDWLDASMLMATGDPARAADLLAAAVAVTSRHGTHLWVSFLLAELAEAAVATGDASPLVGASAVVARSGPAGERGRQACEGLARGAGALLATDLVRAEQELRRSVAGFAAAGWVLWEGRARALLARTLSSGDKGAAMQELDRACRLFGDCGAERRRDAAQRLLGAAGAGDHRVRGAQVGRVALTGREREVAGHALRGCSAREIGARLFIGERTVETHLAHIYAKLGVSGRAELARRYRDSDSL